MNIEEMPAGRELDALIAEKVMGWKLHHHIKNHVQDEMWYFTGRGSEVVAITDSEHCDGRWSPSTDIAAAWEVVEKANVGQLTKWQDRWQAVVDKGDGQVLSGFCDTAPLAICRAALKACL